jgi:hypothetical protein
MGAMGFCVKPAMTLLITVGIKLGYMLMSGSTGAFRCRSTLDARRRATYYIPDASYSNDINAPPLENVRSV